MSHDAQRLADYLGHILEAIERIDRYTEDIDEVAFLQNEMAQDAVIRNIEIIGEASHNIEVHFPDFAAAGIRLPDAQCGCARLFQGRSGNCMENRPERFGIALQAGTGSSRPIPLTIILPGATSWQ